MFHMLGYGSAVLASTPNQNLNVTSDGVITVSAAGRYVMPTRCRIIAASALNDFLQRARFNAPSLRNTGLPEIFPITVGSAPSSNPTACYWTNFGPTVQANEELGLEITDGASVTLNASGFALIQDAPVPVPAGMQMTIFGSASVTLVKNGWANAQLVLDQTLPYGTYAVVGMACVGTNGYVARLIFPRAGVYRPGCPVSPTVGALDFRQEFRCGRLGTFGSFVQTALPLLEVFGLVAGAQTFSVILDLVQTSTGP
jgi:hypothetical protein